MRNTNNKRQLLLQIIILGGCLLFFGGMIYPYFFAFLFAIWTITSLPFKYLMGGFILLYVGLEFYKEFLNKMNNTNKGSFNFGCLGLVWVASLLLFTGVSVSVLSRKQETGITPPNFWFWHWLFFLGLVFAPFLYIILKDKWKKK